jgi:hypothetical protein
VHCYFHRQKIYKKNKQSHPDRYKKKKPKGVKNRKEQTSAHGESGKIMRLTGEN